MGDYKSTMFSVTPGLHSQPDLIYMPNICLQWHKCMHARQHAGMRSYMHVWPSVITMLRHAVSVSSNFITCIIHRYIHLLRIIRHNMPQLLNPGNQGEEEGSRPSMAIWIPIRKLSSVLKNPPPIPIPIPTPHCFNRLLLWQSSGICLQSSKTAVCEAGKLTTLPHTACPLIGFLLYWKHINDVDMTTTGAKQYKIILKGNTWLNRHLFAWTMERFSKLQRDHRGKKGWNPLSLMRLFYPLRNLGLISVMLILLGASVLRCWTWLQCSPGFSDLVKKCCLKQRWGSKCCWKIWAATWASAFSLLSVLALRNWYAVTLKIAEIWFKWKEVCSILCFDHLGFIHPLASKIRC